MYVSRHLESQIFEVSRNYPDMLKKKVQPAVILCLSDEMIPYQRNTWYFRI